MTKVTYTDLTPTLSNLLKREGVRIIREAQEKGVWSATGEIGKSYSYPSGDRTIIFGRYDEPICKYCFTVVPDTDENGRTIYGVNLFVFGLAEFDDAYCMVGVWLNEDGSEADYERDVSATGSPTIVRRMLVMLNPDKPHDGPLPKGMADRIRKEVR